MRVRKQAARNIRTQTNAFKQIVRREAQHKLGEVELFYFRERAAGRSRKEIARQLIDIHNKEQKAVKDAAAKGKSPRSVRSFAARLAVAAKGALRDAVRRVAQESEFRMFEENGLGANGWVWIAANGGEACPDCTPRHGVQMTKTQWQNIGMPGTGLTICGGACMCALEPVEYVQNNESLVKPLQYKKPVIAQKSTIKTLNRSRIEPETVHAGLPETHTAVQPGTPSA